MIKLAGMVVRWLDIVLEKVVRIPGLVHIPAVFLVQLQPDADAHASP